VLGLHRRVEQPTHDLTHTEQRDHERADASDPARADGPADDRAGRARSPARRGPYLTAAPPWTLSAGRGLELGASALRIGGAPVVVVASPADARVVLVARERLADAERVRFEIPGEGIRGHADVQLIDWIWTVRDVVVVER
jgi:hypothetical protein